ncbi:MAG: hypothetical protein ACOCWA_05580 [Bacteroidota bacterium]
MASNPYKITNFPDFRKIDSLSKKEAEKEIKQLREAINYHDHRYNIKNDPVISDKSCDTLLKGLEDLERKSNFECKQQYRLPDSGRRPGQ